MKIETFLDTSYKCGPLAAINIFIMFLLSGFNLEGNRGDGKKDSDNYQAVVKFRFHNVRGLSDDKFRQFYLNKARSSCDILVLAETNCTSTEDETRWEQDWTKKSAVFWASCTDNPGTRGANCRGMAVMISNRVPLQNAKIIAKDPGGRYIAIQCKLHDRDTIIVGCHADNGSDIDQEDFYERMKRDIPAATPGTDIILLGDFNNTTDRGKDVWYRDKKNTSNPIHQKYYERPKGIDALGALRSHLGDVTDVFRTLHPNKLEFSRLHTINRTIHSKGRIDRGYILERMIRGNAPRLITSEHIWPCTSTLETLRNLDSTKKTWSDHAAFQMSIRYSDSKKTKQPWSLPLHLLQNTETVDSMRTIIHQSLTSEKITESEKISLILKRTKEWAIEHIKKPIKTISSINAA